MDTKITKEEIKKRIVEVRGKKVILASELARLFELETKYINRVVKRNIDYFNVDNYFQITKNEYEEIALWFQNLSSRCQFVTLNDQKNNRGANLKYLPYVFTREGIVVLFRILKSEKVREISKIILDAFNDVSEYEIIKQRPEIWNENIQNMIFEIRGKQVILDSDVARLFDYSTKDLNRNVKNNIERFPENYCFQLTEEEYSSLRCKFFTLNDNGRGQHKKYLPYVFTEYGITMLAGLLKSDVAIQASINIVNTFIEMRKILISNNIFSDRLSNVEGKILDLDKKVMELYKEFDKNNPKEFIFLNGQIYDSYAALIALMKKTRKELIIIDGYADIDVLDMISKLKSDVILITKSKGNLKSIDIQKYNEQYNNLKVIYNDDFHDRFIILDKEQVYHLGASVNYIGKRVFVMNRLEDKDVINTLLKKVEECK